MKLPVKIDDGLKDTIVAIQYVSELPIGTDLGYFHMALKGELKGFVNYNKPKPVQGLNLFIDENSNTFITSDESVKVVFSRGEISFNIVKSYFGWDEYFSKIKNILKLLVDTSVVTNISRIGVRYISQFEDTEIFEKINGNISLSFVPQKISGVSRFELATEEFIILLTLTNRQRVPENISSAKFISVVDVDVFKNFNNLLTDYKDVVSVINKAHSIEKEVFFKLLDKDFLQTLNPKYS